MLFYMVFISLLYTPRTQSICSSKEGNRIGEPSKDTDYSLRPNLFVDKDNLVGKPQRDNDSSHVNFSYGHGLNGLSHWAKMFPACGGKHQSPIDIQIPSLKQITLPKLKWSEEYNNIPDKMSISSYDYTVKLTVAFNGTNPRLEGGPLSKPYIFKEFHFHWGPVDTKGSEHTINKKTFPMEMHAVHYRSDVNYTFAMKVDKGLAVVAYLFEIGDDCNDGIEDLVEVFPHLNLETHSTIVLPNYFLLDNLVEKFEKQYVTYQGSLTTPPCHESVTWLLSPYTIALSKKQMEKFRTLSIREAHRNYRGTQPLNNRVVNFVN